MIIYNHEEQTASLLIIHVVHGRVPVRVINRNSKTIRQLSAPTAITADPAVRLGTSDACACVRSRFG